MQAFLTEMMHESNNADKYMRTLCILFMQLWEGSLFILSKLLTQLIEGATCLFC